MKTVFLLSVLLVLASSSSTREEGESGESYFEEEGADCSSFSGTYSTKFELTFGSLGQNYAYYTADEDDSGDTRDFFGFLPGAQVPDLPGRIAIYDDCKFVINLNSDADSWFNYHFYDDTDIRRSNNTRVKQRYNGNSENEFYIPIVPYEGIVTGNNYLCGIASQNFQYGEGSSISLTGPNFLLYTPNDGNNYLGGSMCTIVNRKSIYCSLVFMSGEFDQYWEVDESEFYTYEKPIGINYRARLTLRNHDIDDDIDADVSGVTFLTECATRPIITQELEDNE